MKTPFILMADSAMGDKQRFAILSNELIRRLSTIDTEYTETEEIIRVIEEFIQEMKSSGYKREITREVTISGVKGWKRKIDRRKQEGSDFYRTAKKTLKTRIKKKLTEKETWFKEKIDDDEEPGEGRKVPEGGEAPQYWREEEKGKGRKEKGGASKQQNINTNVLAVMFIPFTRNSGLARRYRQSEGNMGALCDYRLKFVERAGRKISDILTTSNPWRGKDCERDRCVPCDTKERTGKDKGQDCSKRSLVYETWCLDCEQKKRKRK